MWVRKFALAAAFTASMISIGQAAGLASFEVPASSDGPALKVTQWSPCAKPDGAVQLGPFTLPAVRDCPIEGDGLPLIIISHGFGGTNLSHNDTGEFLAKSGFVAVALNHPDDSAFNEKRGHNLTALLSRPTDIRRLIDFMLGASPTAGKIDPRRIGFFGFSRGGYTGLVLAGAKPDFRQLLPACQDPAGVNCRSVDSPLITNTGVQSDPRIAAFVIADPLSSVFATKESVGSITAPIQLWRSEYGGDGVSPEDVATVARHLPARSEFHTVTGSGHFAFLTICPAALRKALPEICIDGADFSREAFHQKLNSAVVAFFRETLPQVVPQ